MAKFGGMIVKKEDVQKQMEFITKVKKINEGKNLNYYILTMGCQLNENDSEKICGMIENMGYSKTDDLNEADLVLFNTCCVRENAEDKLFGKLGEVKKIKEKRGTIIAIGGCMMQEKHIQEKLKKSYPFFDIIFGTHTIHKFPEDLYRVMQNEKQIQDILDIDGEIIEGLPIKRNDKIRASVTIMNGCNNFCTYCIVPYVRGRERSRDPEDIINEVKSLAKEGYKEITLLGQNVNSYGKDLDTDVDFADLIRMVNDIEGVERIRFMTSHPKDLSDKLIDAMAECDKVCKQLHLPVQAGSNKILKEMNRKYTKEDYLAKIEKVKKRIPNISLSTDIIVGFPTETKEDFEETLDVLRKVEYDNIFSFIYSRREGTPAAKLDFVLTDEEIHENFNKLLEVQNEISKRKNEAYVGRVEKVLVDGVSKNDETTLSGRCDSSKIVNFKGDKSLIGKYIDVRITEAHTWSLNGEIAE